MGSSVSSLGTEIPRKERERGREQGRERKKERKERERGRKEGKKKKERKRGSSCVVQQVKGPALSLQGLGPPMPRVRPEKRREED